MRKLALILLLLTACGADEEAFVTLDFGEDLGVDCGVSLESRCQLQAGGSTFTRIRVNGGRAAC